MNVYDFLFACSGVFLGLCLVSLGIIAVIFGIILLKDIKR
jgi:hypothetical protein